MISNTELKSRLDRMTNSLPCVAGELMRRACGDQEEHLDGCNCNTCLAFLVTQNAITELDKIIKEID